MNYTHNKLHKTRISLYGLNGIHISFHKAHFLYWHGLHRLFLIVWNCHPLMYILLKDCSFPRNKCIYMNILHGVVLKVAASLCMAGNYKKLMSLLWLNKESCKIRISFVVYNPNDFDKILPTFILVKWACCTFICD